MEVMTAGASEEEEGSGTYISKGWPGVRARVTPPRHGRPPSWELGEQHQGGDRERLPGDSGSSAEGQGISCPPGGHSPPLPGAEKEERVCDGERRLPTVAGSLPRLLISLPPLTAHLGIRTPFFLFCFTDSLRNLSSASHGPRSSPAELSSSSQHLLRERKSSAPSHSSQPTLFTFEPPVSNHMQPALSTSAPQEYLYLHQCVSRRAENAR